MRKAFGSDTRAFAGCNGSRLYDNIPIKLRYPLCLFNCDEIPPKQSSAYDGRTLLCGVTLSCTRPRLKTQPLGTTHKSQLPTLPTISQPLVPEPFSRPPAETTECRRRAMHARNPYVEPLARRRGAAHRFAHRHSTAANAEPVQHIPATPKQHHPGKLNKSSGLR